MTSTASEISYLACRMVMNDINDEKERQRQDDESDGIVVGDMNHEYCLPKVYKEFIQMPIYEGDTPTYLYINIESPDIITAIQEAIKNSEDRVLYTHVDVDIIAVNHIRDLMIRQNSGNTWGINVIDLKLTTAQLENDLLDEDRINLYNTSSLPYFFCEKWESILYRTKLESLRTK